MEYAPIVLFSYCRPDHTKKTIESLLKNKECINSDLYVYSDFPKNKKASQGVFETRKYIKTISGFKSVNIIERDCNWGLAKSLIDGITTNINERERVIVLEDDIVTSPYFLQFMNDSLQKYKDIENVGCIQGYMYNTTAMTPEVFLTQWIGCWGWATWKRAWDDFCADASFLLNQITTHGLQKKFNMDDCYPFTNMLRNQRDGKIDSWAIRWYASNFLNGRLSLNAGRSLVMCIGNDGNGGVHCSKTNKYNTILSKTPIDVLSVNLCTQEDFHTRMVLSKCMLKVQRLNVRIKRIIHKLHLSWLCRGYFEKLKWN